MTSFRDPTHPDVAPIAEALESSVLGVFSNPTTWIVLLVLCWVGIGLATAVVLRRRSHEFGPNAVLGVVLGPLFVFLAYDMVRRRESVEAITLSHPSDASGTSVLVVVVGELEEPDTVVRLLADLDEVGPVTVAVPVEYEVAQRVHALGGFPPTSDLLDQLAGALSRFAPGKMMLPGPLEKSIPPAAVAGGADIVALVGTDCQTAAPGLEEDLRARLIRAGS